jgi:hypothetical protein
LVPFREDFLNNCCPPQSTHPTKEVLQYSVSVHLPGLPLGLLILLGLLFAPDFQRWGGFSPFWNRRVRVRYMFTLDWQFSKIKELVLNFIYLFNFFLKNHYYYYFSLPSFVVLKIC